MVPEGRIVRSIKELEKALQCVSPGGGCSEAENGFRKLEKAETHGRSGQPTMRKGHTWKPVWAGREARRGRMERLKGPFGLGECGKQQKRRASARSPC